MTTSAAADKAASVTVTGNAEITTLTIGFDDVDGGLTSLLSPVYTLGNWDEIILDFWYWYSNNLGNNPGTDHFVIEFRENNNLPFQILFDTTISTDGWKRISYYLYFTTSISLIQCNICSEYINTYNNCLHIFIVFYFK